MTLRLRWVWSTLREKVRFDATPTHPTLSFHRSIHRVSLQWLFPLPLLDLFFLVRLPRFSFLFLFDFHLIEYPSID